MVANQEQAKEKIFQSYLLSRKYAVWATSSQLGSTLMLPLQVRLGL